MNQAYSPLENGAIVAMRIYLDHGYQPMAQLISAFGYSYFIHLDDVDERRPFLAGVNAYTIVYDERTSWHTFESFMKNPK